MSSSSPGRPVSGFGCVRRATTRRQAEEVASKTHVKEGGVFLVTAGLAKGGSQITLALRFQLLATSYSSFVCGLGLWPPPHARIGRLKRYSRIAKSLTCEATDSPSR